MQYSIYNLKFCKFKTFLTTEHRYKLRLPIIVKSVELIVIKKIKPGSLKIKNVFSDKSVHS